MPSVTGIFFCLSPVSCFHLLQNLQYVFSRLVKQKGAVNLALNYLDKRISLEKTVVGFLAEGKIEDEI